MCGIRVFVVAQLMIMAVQKCAKDPSHYVRRCAATAIPKLYALNKEQYQNTLEELIGMLLDDKSAGVLGAAAAAFNAVCPDHFEILAPRFHEVCRRLGEVEEWGQVLLVDILHRYVVAAHGYPGVEDIGTDDGSKIPHDRACLLECTLPLLWSHNSAVVLAAARVHWTLASSEQLRKIVKPLLFLLRSSVDSQYVVLANLLTLAKEKPSLFEEYYGDFFVCSSDNYHVRAMKLEILAVIARESSISAILQELQAYINDPNRDFAADAVRIIGVCAKKHPSISFPCMEGLLDLVQGVQNPGSDQDRIGDGVILQAVLAIRSVASEHFSQVEKVFMRLIRDLDLIRVPAARAVVIWMIGEYSSKSSLVREILPTVFSYLASCFVDEENESKLQILNCISKAIVKCWNILGGSLKTALLALSYILDLGVCDVSYDVRDRARMLQHLMDLHRSSMIQGSSDISDMLKNTCLEKGLESDSNSSSNGNSKQLLRTVPNCLLAFPKSTSIPLLSLPARTFLLGSMSHVVNHCAPGYRSLPEPHSFTALPIGSTRGISELISADGTFTTEMMSEEVEEESEYTESMSSDGSASDDSYDSTTGLKIAGDGFTGSKGGEGEFLSLNESREVQGGLSCTGNDVSVAPLIDFSDTEATETFKPLGINEKQVPSGQSGISSLSMKSGDDFELWLASGSSSNKQASGVSRMSSGCLNLSMDSIKREPRKITLLDFTNGEGLEVKYSFCFGDPTCHKKMVWLKLYLTNRSSDAVSAISLKDTESELAKDVVKPRVVVLPSPELHILDPHQMREFDMYVDFQQQLVPVKLAINCNQNSFLVKIVPDVGTFLRPKVMTSEQFSIVESKLIGMFEITCRCFLDRRTKSQSLAELDADEEALAVARMLASRILSQINVFLVTATIPVYHEAISDDILSVHLKFSGETLVDDKLCLVTLTLELDPISNNASTLLVEVKVNCEDSVFGSNILNRFQKAVTEKQ
ncbi:hypothetical protein KP509_28G061600 [Ceratopteris richardii]|nr:hypothetical protein KP509_28G061600 [Ceratopteris richardii]KAH7294226.1 hypothetical protein KP509_28G061600 [Ceratopteris richardii]KAH7294227.1 hypothetical protein KP509_28G061600 [Ceratopteris richardii]